jgi:endoglucanase
VRGIADNDLVPIRSRLAAIGALVLSAAVATTSAPPASAAGSGNPFAGKHLYVDPNSPAAQNADSMRQSNPHDAAELDKIAKHSQADWFGDWNSNASVQRTVADRRRTIHRAGAIPVFVVYDIPLRDCGGYSSGGAQSPASYREWVRNFTAGVGRGTAAVVLEPDALAGMDCLRPEDQTTRLGLLRYAVRTLTSHPKTAVYLDAGHSVWQPADVMADRLRRADVADARGFSLNVSNFDRTREERRYGRDIVSLLGGKHFVVDTSRNGLGSNGDWCNPPGRALGHRPTSVTHHRRVDAYLWIKRPGESDGSCNGGPPAGQWWTDYAVGLAERASY